MPKVSKRDKTREKDARIAAKNRRELIAAGLKRRDLMKMGLLTAAGMLIPKKGLSAHPLTSAGFVDDDEPNSPDTTPFVEEMPRLFVLPQSAALTPAPTIIPNTAAGEARTVPHQAFAQFPPLRFYEMSQQEGFVNMAPPGELPPQPIWGFAPVVNGVVGNAMTPGPLIVERYGNFGSPQQGSVLVRQRNNLPENNPPSRPTCTTGTRRPKVTASPASSWSAASSTTTTTRTSTPASTRRTPARATSKKRCTRCGITTTASTTRRKTPTRVSPGPTSSSTSSTPATRPRASACPLSATAKTRSPTSTSTWSSTTRSLTRIPGCWPSTCSISTASSATSSSSTGRSTRCSTSARGGIVSAGSTPGLRASTSSSSPTRPTTPPSPSGRSAPTAT